MTRALYCLVPDLHRAMTLLCQIDDLKISTEGVSLLVAENHVSHTDALLIDGEVLANVIGAPTHVGAFVHLGPLLVIGPLQEKIRAAFIALTAAQRDGFHMPAIIETFLKMGIPLTAASCYASGLRGGRTLMSVHPRTNEDMDRVNQLIIDLNVKR